MGQTLTSGIAKLSVEELCKSLKTHTDTQTHRHTHTHTHTAFLGGTFFGARWDACSWEGWGLQLLVLTPQGQAFLLFSRMEMSWPRCTACFPSGHPMLNPPVTTASPGEQASQSICPQEGGLCRDTCQRPQKKLWAASILSWTIPSIPKCRQTSKGHQRNTWSAPQKFSGMNKYCYQLYMSHKKSRTQKRF